MDSLSHTHCESGRFRMKYRRWFVAGKTKPGVSNLLGGGQRTRTVIAGWFAGHGLKITSVVPKRLNCV